MIFRRRKPQVDLTNDAYQRWLMACRPPFKWFLSLSPIEQQALADIGEAYMQDMALALGYAVHNPELAEMGAKAPTNPESEEQLVRKLVGEFLGKMGATPPPVRRSEPPPPVTMGGLGERRKAAEEERKAREPIPTFLGRPPGEQT